MNNLKPYTVNMVSLGFFLKHNGELLIKNTATVTEYCKEVGTLSYRSECDTFVGSNRVHLPIVNLDGVLVLLSSNIREDHLMLVEDSYVIPSIGNEFDFDEVEAINFFDIEDLDLLDCLTHEGLLQLERFHAAREDYNSACIIRDIRLEELKSKV